MTIRLLVTGAAGQVGAEIPAVAAGRDIEIVAMARADLDITDKAAVAAAIGAAQPAVVVNLAAYTAVDRAESEADAAFAANRDGAANVAAAAALCGAAVLHVSTDYIFDGAKACPYREDDPVSPLSVYGQSKAAGEAAVMAANPCHLIVRTSWVFGRHGSSFVKTMLRLAESRSAVSVVDDQRGCPTPAIDLAQTLLHLSCRCQSAGFKDWGIYHYTGDEPVTWCAFAEAIFAAAGKPVAVNPTTTAEYGAAAARPANGVLDCGRILRRFGLSQPSWRHGLARLLEPEAGADS